jgi:hypothetical protein
MKSKSIAVLGILLFLSVSARAGGAETRQLSWSAVTTYTDGTPIEAGNTVQYTVFWSNDPWLAADTLRTLNSSTTATSVAFDPAAEGMSDYQTVYFTVKSVLSTGEESTLSDAMPWSPPPATVSAGVPMVPTSFGITNVSTSTSAGTWKLFWDPVTKDTSGNTIEGNTVRYTLYWTIDAALSPASLTMLSSAMPETSFVFDPTAVGMKGNQKVFFTAKTVLTTGEESALSAALSWRASNRGPGAPKNGRIVRKNKK